MGEAKLVALFNRGKLVTVDTPAGLASRSGRDQRVGFRPSQPMDDQWLLDLPEVRDVSHHGERIDASGTGNLLAPEPLDGARLPEAMQQIAARWSALHGVPVTVTTNGEARVMRPEIEVTLLRTAQEALANVAKHAAARRVGLTLSYMEDLVTLDVRDDGVGFAAPADPATLVVSSNGNGDHGGFGLAAMRQRVEGVAGALQVESEPLAGTAISASVPAIPAGGAA